VNCALRRPGIKKLGKSEQTLEIACGV